MSTKRLRIACRTKQLSVFSGITDLNIMTKIVSKADPVVFMMHTFASASHISCDQAASLLEAVAADLIKLVIVRCDVMNGIYFPALEIIECTGPVFGDGLPVEYMANCCPVLHQVSVNMIRRHAMHMLSLMDDDYVHTVQVSGITVLRIKCLSGILDDHVSRMFNLKRLSITARDSVISNSLFKYMYQLVDVNLTVNRIDWVPKPIADQAAGDDDDEVAVWDPNDGEDEDEFDEESELFSDYGVQILLENNQQLKEVTLSGFPMTDLSLVYFTDYISAHGLDMLSLVSTHGTGFTAGGKKLLADAASVYNVKELSVTNEWLYQGGAGSDIEEDDE
jgi:hypothetical protein